MPYLCLLLLIISCCGCSSLPTGVERSLQKGGANRKELEKVIAHYKRQPDRRKLEAAYYLLSNLPGHYHYEGNGVAAYQQVFHYADSLQRSDSSFNREFIGDSIRRYKKNMPMISIHPVDDIHTLTADFLIKNIEEAFRAWAYPWARRLSFEEFCRYLLPYKLKNEVPELWRGYFQKRYGWLKDSLKNNPDPLQACILINNDLKRWFYFSKFNFPFDPSCSNLLTTKAGKCPEEVQLTTYAMRAMGLPVTMDYVPLWANRNSNHDWNSLVLDKHPIAFLGTEINPGEYKVEFAMPGSISSKRGKIFRHSYNQSELQKRISDDDNVPGIFKAPFYTDVTGDYLPVSEARIEMENNDEQSWGYLCVFNNKEWRPIDIAALNHDRLTFTKLGRNVIYLPGFVIDGEVTPTSLPFLLDNNGDIKPIAADLSKRVHFTIDRKYPAGDDNKVVKGERYELLYWDRKKWRTVVKKVADAPKLDFTAPTHTLLWLRNLDKGAQERIFMVDEHEKIQWY